MSKRQLIEAISIAGHGSISDAAAARALDSLTRTVTGTLLAGERFTFPGLGTFIPGPDGVVFQPCCSLARTDPHR